MNAASVRDSIVMLGLSGVQSQGMRRILTGADVHSVRELLEKGRQVHDLPARLQFRLRGFNENDSTDSGLQGASDEVFMSAIGTDSASVTIGPDGKPVLNTLSANRIGDVSSDDIRGPWSATPLVWLEFDLRKPSDWPRCFVVTLLIVEEDNSDLAEAFSRLESEAGAAVEAAVVTAAEVGSAALAGAAVGSIIPGIGNAVGAAVGVAAAVVYGAVIENIEEGLDNDIFTPRAIQLDCAEPALMQRHPSIGPQLQLNIQEHGANYDLFYDWCLVD